MRILREPLFHFIVLGVVLFLAYAVTSDLLSADASHRITISAADIQLLAESWSRRWQRPPTERELRGLVEARVREEVLYREALAVGLDENDAIVRRRMVQKMEMLSQDLALLADPTDRELRKFFADRQEDYRVPPRLSFSQVYFNMDRRGAAGEEEADRVLADLRAQAAPPGRAAERGDRFMMGHDFAQISPDEVAREFGEAFAAEIFALEPGWQGPIASGYGLHVVFIGERIDSRIPEYAEVRQRLVNDYNRQRSENAKAALFEGLSARYEISIDDEAVKRAALEGTRQAANISGG